jgi:DNA-binding transcriptional ArsR family regulator
MARAKAHQIEEREYFWDKRSGSFIAKDGLAAATSNAGKPRTADRFLKGPVPWKWVIRASGLPGKALIIGLCLWRLKGATRKAAIPLSNSELEPFGIDRAAKSRGLAALEKAGLISVERKRSRWPVVTLLG